MSKDKMRRFTPEQQETLAALEARRVQKREELMEQARNYRGRTWLPPLVVAICFLGCLFETNHRQMVPYFIGLALWISIQFHARGVNRRLDALMDLLRADKTEGS